MLNVLGPQSGAYTNHLNSFLLYYLTIHHQIIIIKQGKYILNDETG